MTNVEQQERDNKCETLFWKLIRNKFIFYQILNKLATPNEEETISKYYDSFKYDDIIHVDWIIENGYIQLLKYKVSRGDLLVCGGFHTILDDGSNKSKRVNKFDFKRIFKSIHSDIDFYNSLYSNYSNYIESTNKIIQLSIKTNNYIALSTFLNHNNKQFKICTNDSKSSSSSTTTTTTTPIEIVKSLFKQKSPSKKIIKLVIDMLDESFENKKDFKLVFQSLIIMNQVSSIKTLNYILENSKLITKEIKSKISIISFLEDKIPNTLNHLIHSCRLILNLNQQQQDGTSDNITKKGFESIVTKLKSKQLLKSKVISAITTNDKEDGDIKQLLKLFISVKEGIEQYTYIYNLMYNQKPITTPTIFNTIHFIQSLKFGDFNYFNNIIKNEINLSKCLKSLNEFKNKKENSKLLFKYCSSDQDKQTEFINQVIGSMNSNSKITISHYQLLIYLIIQTDNLSLMELTIKLIPSSIDLNSINTKEFNLPIQKYIYSIELLNFCFNHFKNHFYLKDWSSNFFLKFNKLELFKQFEILNKQQQHHQEEQKINFKSGIQRNLECKEIYFERLQLFKYIIESGYQYSSHTVLPCIKVPNYLENKLTIKEFDEIIIPIFKVIIGKNVSYFVATDIICSKTYRNQYIKFLDWVEDSSKLNNYSSLIYQYGVSSKPNYHRLYSRPITKDKYIDTITAFEMGRVGDLSTIESCYNKNKFSVYNVYTNMTFHTSQSWLLYGAAKFGRLQVIEFIYSKDSNPELFTEIPFVKHVIESNHFHLFDYLLENVNSFSDSITKQNFKEYCISENSIFYKKYINYFK